MFFTSDHLIENPSILTRSLKTNVKNLSDENIFIFGINQLDHPMNTDI